MSWTPHSTEQLNNAGVKFGVGDTVSNLNPVIQAMSASGTPININTGISGSGINSSYVDSSALLGSVGQAAGLTAGGLEELIMKNTDKNNAWSAGFRLDTVSPTPNFTPALLSCSVLCGVHDIIAPLNDDQ